MPKTGSEILEAFNAQAFGVTEGYKTLDEMIDEELAMRTDYTQKMALDVLADASTSTAYERGQRSGLAGAFYMMGLIDEAAFKKYGEQKA